MSIEYFELFKLLKLFRAWWPFLWEWWPSSFGRSHFCNVPSLRAITGVSGKLLKVKILLPFAYILEHKGRLPGYCFHILSKSFCLFYFLCGNSQACFHKSSLLQFLKGFCTCILPRRKRKCCWTSKGRLVILCWTCVFCVFFSSLVCRIELILVSSILYFFSNRFRYP